MNRFRPLVGLVAVSLLLVSCASTVDPEAAPPPASTPEEPSSTPTPTPTQPEEPAGRVPTDCDAVAALPEISPTIDGSSQEEDFTQHHAVIVQAGGLECTWTGADGLGVLGFDVLPDAAEVYVAGTTMSEQRSDFPVPGGVLGCEAEWCEFAFLTSSEFWIEGWTRAPGATGEATWDHGSTVSKAIHSHLDSLEAQGDPWPTSGEPIPADSLWLHPYCAETDVSSVGSALGVTLSPSGTGSWAHDGYSGIWTTSAAGLGWFPCGWSVGELEPPTVEVMVLPGGGWAAERAVAAANRGAIEVAGADAAALDCRGDDEQFCVVDLFANGDWLQVHALVPGVPNEEAALPVLEAIVALPDPVPAS